MDAVSMTILEALEKYPRILSILMGVIVSPIVSALMR